MDGLLTSSTWEELKRPIHQWEPIGRVWQRFACLRASPSLGSPFPRFLDKCICPGTHCLHSLTHPPFPFPSVLPSPTPLIQACAHGAVNWEVTDWRVGCFGGCCLSGALVRKGGNILEQPTSMVARVWQPGSHPSWWVVNRVGQLMKVDQGKLKHCPPACTLTSSIRAYLAILEPLYSLSIQDEVRGLQILLALGHVLTAHWEICFPNLALSQSNQTDRLPISGPEQHSCLH